MAWIDTLFHQMVQQGASDLHMSSHLSPMFRVDGSMQAVAGYDEMSPDRVREALYEIAPEESRVQFENGGDTDFAYEIPGLARFRANLFMDRNGPGGVFRQIPSEILTAEQLGLPPAILEMCQLTKGLVVVTGPTGSGKSTTLAAMIDYINRTRDEHIITIEDPIEFVHPNKKCLINQREVGRHTKGFKTALRAALREDPDIVLVGEMRDLETVEIAIETAETGHLVFGTLHTTTAPSTVDRIIDQFSADRQAQIRTMLSESLKGVIAQTLCKKQPRGRVAALEILRVTPAVSANIREGKTHQVPSLMQMGAKYGMRLLNDSLAELVQQGHVAAAEAYVKAVNKDDLLSRMNALGLRFDPASIGEGAAEAASAPATPQPAPAPGQRQPAAPMPGPGQPATPMPGQTPAGAAPQPAPPAPLPGQAPAAEAPAPGYVDPFESFKRNKR